MGERFVTAEEVVELLALVQALHGEGRRVWGTDWLAVAKIFSLFIVDQDGFQDDIIGGGASPDAAWLDALENLRTRARQVYVENGQEIARRSAQCEAIYAIPGVIVPKPVRAHIGESIPFALQYEYVPEHADREDAG